MTRQPFLKDTRHLWTLGGLIVLCGIGFVGMRSQMIPESFGQTGPYRAAALTEIAARPSVWQSDAVCHECHEDVEEERADSLHKDVRCSHCHGVGREHVAQARRAAESPESPIDPAEEWDGDFLTSVDLYITTDRKTCLVCHEDQVGMPVDFKKIDFAEHLEEQGASEPDSKEACFECHAGHDPAP